MDSPYDSKSYFPPVQLLQKDIFAYVMAQMDVNPEFAVTMTQMSANAGLKKHGKKAEEALLAEFSQLEDLNVYEPLDPNKLTRAQKKAALRAINLIKEKRCGRLKVHFLETIPLIKTEALFDFRFLSKDSLAPIRYTPS